MALVNRSDQDMSLRKQCELLSLHRSLIYYKPAGESSLNLELMRIIDELHLLDPSLGSPRIHSLLQRMDYSINRKRVERLMRKMGIQARYPKPKTTSQNPDHQKFPYLLRELKIERPGQVWCTDITYIPIEGGFFYLVAIMDWYSRYILSWELSNSMETSFCLDALEAAFIKGIPEIFNSDQGSQFTSNRFVEALQQKQIQVSHDGKGRFIDNIFIERFWRSLKYEEVYAFCYTDGEVAYNRIANWINRYNCIRPHQSLKYSTPEEIYFGWKKKKRSISEIRKFFL